MAFNLGSLLRRAGRQVAPEIGEGVPRLGLPTGQPPEIRGAVPLRRGEPMLPPAVKQAGEVATSGFSPQAPTPPLPEGAPSATMPETPEINIPTLTAPRPVAGVATPTPVMMPEPAPAPAALDYEGETGRLYDLLGTEDVSSIDLPAIKSFLSVLRKTEPQVARDIIGQLEANGVKINEADLTPAPSGGRPTSVDTSIPRKDELDYFNTQFNPYLPIRRMADQVGADQEVVERGIPVKIGKKKTGFKFNEDATDEDAATEVVYALQQELGRNLTDEELDAITIPKMATQKGSSAEFSGKRTMKQSWFRWRYARRGKPGERPNLVLLRKQPELTGVELNPLGYPSAIDGKTDIKDFKNNKEKESLMTRLSSYIFPTPARRMESVDYPVTAGEQLETRLIKKNVIGKDFVSALTWVDKNTHLMGVWGSSLKPLIKVMLMRLKELESITGFRGKIDFGRIEGAGGYASDMRSENVPRRWLIQTGQSALRYDDTNGYQIVLGEGYITFEVLLHELLHITHQSILQSARAGAGTMRGYSFGAPLSAGKPGAIGGAIRGGMDEVVDDFERLRLHTAEKLLSVFIDDYNGQVDSLRPEDYFILEFMQAHMPSFFETLKHSGVMDELRQSGSVNLTPNVITDFAEESYYLTSVEFVSWAHTNPMFQRILAAIPGLTTLNSRAKVDAAKSVWEELIENTKALFKVGMGADMGSEQVDFDTSVLAQLMQLNATFIAGDSFRSTSSIGSLIRKALAKSALFHRSGFLNTMKSRFRKQRYTSNPFTPMGLAKSGPTAAQESLFAMNTTDDVSGLEVLTNDDLFDKFQGQLPSPELDEVTAPVRNLRDNPASRMLFMDDLLEMWTKLGRMLTRQEFESVINQEEVSTVTLSPPLEADYGERATYNQLLNTAIAKELGLRKTMGKGYNPDDLGPNRQSKDMIVYDEQGKAIGIDHTKPQTDLDLDLFLSGYQQESIRQGLSSPVIQNPSPRSSLLDAFVDVALKMGIPMESLAKLRVKWSRGRFGQNPIRDTVPIIVDVARTTIKSGDSRIVTYAPDKLDPRLRKQDAYVPRTPGILSELKPSSTYKRSFSAADVNLEIVRNKFLLKRLEAELDAVKNGRTYSDGSSYSTAVMDNLPSDTPEDDPMLGWEDADVLSEAIRITKENLDFLDGVLKKFAARRAEGKLETETGIESRTAINSDDYVPMMEQAAQRFSQILDGSSPFRELESAIDIYNQSQSAIARGEEGNALEVRTTLTRLFDELFSAPLGEMDSSDPAQTKEAAFKFLSLAAEYFSSPEEVVSLFRTAIAARSLGIQFKKPRPGGELNEKFTFESLLRSTLPELYKSLRKKGVLDELVSRLSNANDGLKVHTNKTPSFYMAPIRSSAGTRYFRAKAARPTE